MTNEQNSINDAFEIYSETDLSKEAREKIAARYGASAADVEAIYKYALNCPVHWRTATMDAELSVPHQFSTINTGGSARKPERKSTTLLLCVGNNTQRKL